MVTYSLKQVVRNAIAVEQAAEAFYRTLSDSTDNTEAKVFLDGMADQEKSHQKRIRNLAAQLQVGDLPFRADDNVELVETAPEWADVDQLDYETALQIALENEEHAVLFYSALCEVSSGTMAAFFKRLMKDEEEHVARLSERLEQR